MSYWHPPPPLPQQRWQGQVPQYSSSQLAPWKFPVTFVSFRSWTSSSTFFLGQPPREKQFTFSIADKQMFGPDGIQFPTDILQLHDGPSKDNHVMATIQEFKEQSQNFVMKAFAGYGMPGQVAMLTPQKRNHSTIYWFSLAGAYGRQDFEWRHGPGQGGWHLVHRGAYEEIVATIEITKKGMSFTFAGSGRTGVYGFHWEIWAVLSATAIAEMIRAGVSTDTAYDVGEQIGNVFGNAVH